MKRLLLPTRFLLAALVLLSAAAAHAQSTVYAMLTTSLDSRTAKVDDNITAKLRQDVKLPGGTNLKEGTVITGHVSAVKDEPGSITLLFDTAVVDDNNTQPIHITIRRIEEGPINSEDTDDDPRKIKADGPAVSKLRGLELQPGDGQAASGTISAKDKNVRLEYKTLLGCVVSGS